MLCTHVALSKQSIRFDFLKSKFNFAFKMGQEIELADTKILFKIPFLSLALKSHAELEPNKPPFLSPDQDRTAF